MKKVDKSRIVENRKTRLVLRILTYIISSLIVALFILAFVPGLKYWSWEFFTQFPKERMTDGGIFPAILGSILLTVTSLAIAIPLGVLLGIVLSEYNLTYIKFAVTILSGIPSVVYGLFGLGLFCITMNMRTSILAGALTLSLMVLPVISSSVYEVMQAIPRELREAAYALGARKSEVIFEMLVPSVRNTILTVSFVSAGRVIGETAPLILTAAVFYATQLPKSLLSPVMTMPTHIYFLTAAYGSSARWMAEGTASVLILFIILVYSIAFMFRREKK
ncbi:MAG: phosphate ABC transporter permease PstA [Fervidobacterium pennivorans]|uniref:Phosphate transport system permease protein PstA n=1 Tax=Fervidobacterium pennivorans (strain DSM 9078 / Ven5) TaxID=771875 RepID=H9UEA6_FERPD|nr:phosphate ABC transporter permease PstA [Fervidobacterium pennivorans]AFG35849.1 phosphate ABC transporter membrane protein 2, PhoT family [Fervidobacterium pennivorans DSM 9078]QIV78585.1 phosphate ABC transporter permease PstA [Fervidobacterium pennivorans subsp. keratinolyticus]